MLRNEWVSYSSVRFLYSRVKVHCHGSLMFPTRARQVSFPDFVEGVKNVARQQARVRPDICSQAPLLWWGARSSNQSWHEGRGPKAIPTSNQVEHGLLTRRNWCLRRSKGLQIVPLPPDYDRGGQEHTQATSALWEGAVLWYAVICCVLLIIFWWPPALHGSKTVTAECACVIRSRCSSNEFCWDSSRKGFARPVQHQRFGEIEAILAIALLLIASDIFQLAY